MGIHHFEHFTIDAVLPHLVSPIGAGELAGKLCSGEVDVLVPRLATEVAEIFTSLPDDGN